MYLPLVALLLTRTSFADPRVDLVAAERFLELNQGIVALKQFEKIVATRPDSGRAKLGYARALGMTGDCARALEVLSDLRGRPVWGAEGAYAEGMCRLRTGDLTGAHVAFAEAVWFRPLEVSGWMYLASVCSQLGDDPCFEEASSQLDTLPGGRHGAAVVAVERSLDLGAVDDFDANLRALVTLAGDKDPSAHLLDARRWLDVDDPAMAVEVLSAAVSLAPSNFQLALWHSEAIRRTGDPSRARGALERRTIQRQTDGALAVTFESRLLVDEGRLGEAAEVLAMHPDPTNLEVVASAWYLARAEGDLEEMARREAQYRQGTRASDRRLEQLVPPHDREQP